MLVEGQLSTPNDAVENPIPGQVDAPGRCWLEFILHRINPVSAVSSSSPEALHTAAPAWPVWGGYLPVSLPKNACSVGWA